MSHKPQHHPLSRIRKECDTIAYLAMTPGESKQPIVARLNFLLKAVDILEEERDILKQRWREKHQALNMATLRIAYLERMLEIARDQNERDRDKIMELSIVQPPVWRGH
jgi:ABC-type uncharacterized transport system ATPase subunit